MLEATDFIKFATGYVGILIRIHNIFCVFSFYRGLSPGYFEAWQRFKTQVTLEVSGPSKEILNATNI